MENTDESRRAQYLVRAEELRAIADQTESAELRTALRNAAESYERMAHRNRPDESG